MPAATKISVTCPSCNQELQVPASALGKQGRCPACKHIFPLVQAAIPAQVIEPPPPPQKPVGTIWDEVPADYSPPGDYSLAPLPKEPTSAQSAMNTYAPSAASTKEKNYYHGFGWEHRGWDAGMTGGLAMMAIAAIWFFGGLAFNIIFYYPAILFLIGLVGFFRGLFTGNISGR